ncbi:uncharacterized protein MONBRDRAFT_6241 [Monosiga brevicollis MX1]|uniref:Uncharacterized protein n=1 Tax=Monosiga brevicollis TaxID=81824 RepID=A9UT88_MONBE|nr:uncharacterized protein MONBRDRAFT_6241 [Monosiga brevicollis MX1]EDQ91451.1 predicted protein [Monosiga brevicollis MX1]|eukprot:XP_001743873.1 hypothetical protein [Monosiga brevicollis MX1]
MAWPLSSPSWIILFAIIGENLQASSLGDTEVVRRCLRRNQRRLDALNRSGWAPLHYACSTGYEHTVAFLLDEAKAHVDVEASDKTTPLMHAAGGGYERIVHRLLKVLLRFGANSKQCDSQGQTPRMLAERMAQPSAIIIDLLNKHEQRNNTSPLRAEAGLDLVTYASQSPSPRPPSLSPMPVTSDTESRLMDAGDDIETFLKLEIFGSLAYPVFVYKGTRQNRNVRPGASELCIMLVLSQGLNMRHGVYWHRALSSVHTSNQRNCTMQLRDDQGFSASSGNGLFNIRVCRYKECPVCMCEGEFVCGARIGEEWRPHNLNVAQPRGELIDACFHCVQKTIRISLKRHGNAQWVSQQQLLNASA